MKPDRGLILLEVKQLYVEVYFVYSPRKKAC